MRPHKPDPRHRIVTAATVILDSYGIADLTMRRLARELDITPGALYWHFASKQQLLGAVADQLLQPVRADPQPSTAAGWRRRVITVCTQMRAALLSHTDGAELVSASFAAGQSRAVDEVLGLLADAATDAGLNDEHAALAARTLIYYVLGSTADEQSRRQWDAAGALSDESIGTRAFEFGMRLLIDGLSVSQTRSTACTIS